MPHLVACSLAYCTLGEAGLDIPVVVGGTIPEQDVEKLRQAGVAAVFPTSTPLATLPDLVRAAIRDAVGGPDRP
jgi:methylmalonyl-CoA mutase C-terminal domain/subunit